MKVEIYLASTLRKDGERRWPTEVTNRYQTKDRAIAEAVVGGVEVEEADTETAMGECMAAEFEELATAS